MRERFCADKIVICNDGRSAAYEKCGRVKGEAEDVRHSRCAVPGKLYGGRLMEWCGVPIGRY